MAVCVQLIFILEITHLYDEQTSGKWRVFYMRRLIAFITLALTLLAIAIINIPSIQDGMNQGIEFKGGFEILYQVLDQNGDEYAQRDKAAATASAAEVIANRVDIAGVKNPQITIEGDDMIRVTIASKTESDTRDLRELISSNAVITFRDTNDNLMATADELLTENGAQLDYQDGNPVVSLKIRNSDLFAAITSQISSSENNRLVIWLGYQETYPTPIEYNGSTFSGDRYADIETNPTAAKRIVSDATVSQTFYSDVIITGSFDAEQAKLMADMIRAGSINFSLSELSVTSIGATYGSQAFTQSLIAGMIGLIAVSILMIVFYGLAGVASSVSLIVYVIGALVVFNLLKGEYGPDTIAATVIGIGMAVDANIISFERTKDELLKGKPLRRAFEEGNKKSLSTILDSNITTLIAAFSLYLFGTRTVKGFASMLIISIALTMVIMVILSKFLLSLLCQSEMMQKHPNWFGVRVKDIPNVTKGESQRYFGRFAKFDFMKYTKKASLASVGLIVITMIGAVIFQFTSGSPFNLGLQFTEGTKLYFRTTDVNLSTQAGVYDFFEDDAELNIVPDLVVVGSEVITLDPTTIDIHYELLENATLNGVDLTVYTVSVNFKQQLPQTIIEYLDTHFQTEQESYESIFQTNYTLNFVSPIVAQKTVQNALLSVLLASLFIVLYVAVRFRFTYSIAAIVALLHDALITLGIFAIFRIELNIEFVSAILAIIGYSINDTIVAFDRLRENINEAGDRNKLDSNVRRLMINQSLQQTIGRSLMTTVSTLLTVISLLILGSRASVNFNIAMLVGLIAGTFSSIYIAPTLWLFLEDNYESFRNRRRATRTKVAKPTGEPEEYVFFGIND